MAGLATIKEHFTSTDAVSRYNAAFVAAGLDPLAAGVAARRHRQLLRGVPQLPALAVELDEVHGEPMAAGLRVLYGRVTLYVALGRADDPAVLARAELYADALREAVETHLRAGFQFLDFDSACAEGEVYGGAGPALRLVPVRFAFRWPYTT